MKLKNIAAPYKITAGRKFRLDRIDPNDTGGYEQRKAAALLKLGVEQLAEMQAQLYAQNRWAVLLIFQAMDAAGKDSAIEHVMSGVNPQGCQVYSFKAPSHEELDHDFLWRCARSLPERGRVGIFNRSYYEEVLVARVHPELLEKQHLPARLVKRRIWADRYSDIANFESYLARNGVAICKFFLHLSKEEQKRRFLERIDKPRKHWKFSIADIHERSYWSEYMAAYEDMVRNTSATHAPWYVLPADHKWYTRLLISSAVVDSLSRLDLGFPEIDAGRRAELEAARAALTSEKVNRRH